MTKKIRIPGYYTSEQICTMYGIDRTTLWRWKNEGLPAYDLKPRQLFRKEEVKEFLKKTDRKLGVKRG